MTNNRLSANNRNSRNLSIDLVKIIAMFGVICWHTTRQFVNLQEVEFSIASFLYRTAAISIPLFFLSSGYLQLGRDNCSWSYSIRKIGKILRYMMMFCVAYWVLQSLKHGVDFKALWQIVSESFIGAGPFYVFWYFGAMILIYLLLPMLNRLYRHRKSFAVMTLVMLMIQNYIHLQLLTNGGGYEDICITIRLYNWLTYFMLGSLIKMLNFKIKCWWLILFLIIANYLSQLSLCSYMNSTASSFYYSSPIIVALAVAILMTSLKIRLSNNNRIIKELSSLFLLTFTLHSFFIGKVTSVMGQLPIASLWIWITVSLITVTVSFLLMKIPYANKIFKI